MFLLDLYYCNNEKQCTTIYEQIATPMSNNKKKETKKIVYFCNERNQNTFKAFNKKINKIKKLL